MYQRTGNTPQYRIDLDNTHALMDALNHPERKLTCVHVAGTNGKGSTCHLVASALQEAGFKTGLYTSPHLVDFRERVRINGQLIAAQEVIDFVERHRAVFESIGLSFFEYTVGLAFDYFVRQQVDVAVIEVGLGGRLDSTNVVSPLVCGITNIGLDHQQLLGDTVQAIAAEKAGIIKPNVPVVIGRKQPALHHVFEAAASKANAPLFVADEMELPTLDVRLPGSYQRENARTAQAILSLLPDALTPTNAAIARGFSQVQTNTGLAGRWHRVGENPTIICDTGHNKDGIEAVLQNIAETPHRALHVVLGMVNDKDVASMLARWPNSAAYYFCKPNIPRGLPVETLHQAAQSVSLHGNAYTSVEEAVEAARAQATQHDLILIGGSTFVVAEALPLFRD